MRCDAATGQAKASRDDPNYDRQRHDGRVQTRYMMSSAPSIDRVVTLHNGAEVAYSRWGVESGRPVVFFHGMPGSRLLCPDLEATTAAGVCLYTVDRPGYGGSTPTTGRTLLSWADDFFEWADCVGLGACPLVGWSSGGPYALACAVRRPERVTSVALVASPGPMDEVQGEWESLSDDVRDLTMRIRRGDWDARARVVERCSWFVQDWAAMFEPGWAVSPEGDVGEDPDDRVLADARVRETMIRETRAAAQQGSAGYVDDWIAESLPWGFSPATVVQPVAIWSGTRDHLVRSANAGYFSAVIVDSTLEMIPDEGHLVPIRHWAAILDSVVRDR